MYSELNTITQIYNKQPANVSFSGQRLYSLNLLKKLPDGTKEKVPAFFTELGKAEDLKLLEEIEKLWTADTSYGGRIISHFKALFSIPNLGNKESGDLSNFQRRLDNIKYFIIECPQFKNTKEKIRALAEVGYNSSSLLNKCKIRYLQSASQLYPINKLDGQGLNMLGGIIKYSMDNKFSNINLISVKDCRDFYEKAGFKPLGNKHNPCGYYADKTFYQDILNIIKAKYGEILPAIKNAN